MRRRRPVIALVGAVFGAAAGGASTALAPGVDYRGEPALIASAAGEHALSAQLARVAVQPAGNASETRLLVRVEGGDAEALMEIEIPATAAAAGAIRWSAPGALEVSFTGASIQRVHLSLTGSPSPE